jgi:nitronate monooxygenase
MVDARTTILGQESQFPQRVPLIVAPMFLVTGPDLVIAACKAGAIGAIPALNARTPAILDEWLARICGALEVTHDAAFAVNLIAHPTNSRLDEDIAVTEKYRVPIVITSVGAPDKIVSRIHRYGGLVLCDVASVKHARKAVTARVDGLVLLCAGAGGNTGTLNPFAFLEAVRKFYDGIIVVAGGITNGRQVRALQMLGADLVYVGTPFIVASESQAPSGYRRALIDAEIDDVACTTAITGIPTNVLRVCLERLRISESGSLNIGDMDTARKPWLLDVWAAGHGVGQVSCETSAAVIVDRFRQELMQAGSNPHQNKWGGTT